ncbi:hypothetical protein Aduo_014440 [Ancylostoma duodenale]
MVKIPVLIIAIVASTIYAYPAAKNSKITSISVDSIPGVSEGNMEKLRKMLIPLPSSTVDLEKIATKWFLGLPAKEKEVIRRRTNGVGAHVTLKNMD